VALRIKQNLAFAARNKWKRLNGAVRGPWGAKKRQLFACARGFWCILGGGVIGALKAGRGLPTGMSAKQQTGMFV
jgi:hypothetical protein